VDACDYQGNQLGGGTQGSLDFDEMVRQQEAHDLEAEGSLTQLLEDSIGLPSHPSTGASDSASKCKVEVETPDVPGCKVEVKDEDDADTRTFAQSKKRRLMQGG